LTGPKQPESWITETGEDGEHYAYPPELNAPGFFEDFFDGEPSRPFWTAVNAKLAEAAGGATGRLTHGSRCDRNDAPPASLRIPGRSSAALDASRSEGDASMLPDAEVVNRAPRAHAREHELLTRDQRP